MPGRAGSLSHEQLERPELRRSRSASVTGQSSYAGHGAMPAVALAAQPQRSRSTAPRSGRPGREKLIWNDRHVATEVVDVEDQVVGQLGGVAPHDPADTERGQAELVARGADRLHPREPEVPHAGRVRRTGRQERRRWQRRRGCRRRVRSRPGARRAPRRSAFDVLVGRRCRSTPRVGTTKMRVLVDAELARPRRPSRSGPATSGSRASRCPSTWRTCARRPATAPHTMFGLSVGLPSASRAWPASATWPPSRASMHASDEPMRRRADDVWPRSGAFHRSASICTQRRSSSAVMRVLVLVDQVLVDAQVHQRMRPAGSSHVWQKVARFWRALPSSISSSWTAW